MGEDLYWLGFSVFPGVGPKKFAQLLATFGRASAAWNASVLALEEVLGIPLTAKFIAFRQTFSLDSYAQKLASRQISYRLLSDPTYPFLLKQLPTAPFVLYIKGNAAVFDASDKQFIGVVGARSHSTYGL